MLKHKETNTQTNKQFHKTDMSHGAKCTSKTSTKNRNTHFTIKQAKKIETAPDKNPKRNISAFKKSRSKQKHQAFAQ